MRGNETAFMQSVFSLVNYKTKWATVAVEFGIEFSAL